MPTSRRPSSPNSGTRSSARSATRFEPGFCLSLLRLVAAIMPFDPLDGGSVRAAAEFLDADQMSMVEAIGHLEAIGVVSRRGRSLRITPDVLADHILHNACLTPQGRQTGYIREVFDKFGGICPAQLLRNLAELDWRVNRTSGGSPVDLLSEVWGDIRREFATADASGRLRILDILDGLLVLPAETHPRHRRVRDEESDERGRRREQAVSDRPSQVLANLPALLRRVC